MKRVRLHLDAPGGEAGGVWPVTGGVPFADGELERGRPVALRDAGGRLVPVQTRCLSAWAPGLRHVRWLLLDFQAPRGESDLWLEYGDGAEGPAPDEPVRVRRNAGALLLDTGPLEMEIRRDAAAFFAGCRVAAPGGARREVLRAGEAPYLYMADQDGTRYDSRAAAPRVEIEEEGPLRAVVRVEGRHVSPDGGSFCPYILRLHVFAGRPEIRLQHTFVFDRDPERVELGEVGMRFPLGLGADARLAVGGEKGPHAGGDAARLEFLQRSDREYRVDRDGAPWGGGARTRGWAGIGAADASAVVVLRDAWQEYPKGIALDGAGADVRVWPAACGESLAFSTPFKEEAVRFGGTRDEAEFRRLVEESPTAPLNLKSLAATSPADLAWVETMVERHAPGRPASYNDTGTAAGRGAAKTTEFWLRCAAGPLDAAGAEAFAARVQEPAVLWPEPAYACATGALRYLAPRGEGRFERAEQSLDGLFERIVAEPRDKLRTYGMVDYGDLMCSHSASPAALWEAVKDRADAAERMRYCARSYNNESNDQLNALWGLFVRSGERRYFAAAAAYGRHMADVDIIHTGDEAGLIHYHNAHHWSGGPSPSHTCLAGLMLQYYLTGDGRLFEVCREIADWALRHREPCGIVANRQGALVREFTTPVANLLEFYQATGERRYFEPARRSVKWLLRTMPEPGKFAQSVYTAGERGDEAEVEQVGWHLRQAGGMTPQLLYDAVLLLGGEEPDCRRALVAMARRYVFHRNDMFEKIRVGPGGTELLDPYFNAPIVAYAYKLTGEAVFAAYCRYYLRHHFVEEAKKTSFTYVCWGSIVPPLMEAARRAEEELGPEALDRAEAEWLERVDGRDDDGARATERPPRRPIGAVVGYE